jgi:hypothetical protein
MMETVYISETSVFLPRRDIPEDSHILVAVRIQNLTIYLHLRVLPKYAWSLNSTVSVRLHGVCLATRTIQT